MCALELMSWDLSSSSRPTAIGWSKCSLFNNAINYGKPGGTCTVRSFPLDDNVLVEVTDNGIGNQ